ncbi:MAG: hypothetical protein K2X32_12060 [Phycisphaerales bacterium]|nr:hypothetical protein [Phycisphaerales bacterium]
MAALTRRIIQPSEFIREYADTPDNAVPLLRAANTTDGEIDLIDFVYVDRSKLGGAADSFIQEGDILVTRTGANAGATSRVPALPREYIVSSHSLRLLPNTDEVDSRYLEAFLLSRWGKAQLIRSMTGAAQKQLQIAGISPILIARPPREVQARLVAALDAARAARRRKLEDAESLLGGLDAFVLEALGLTLPPPNDALRQCWGVRLAETMSERRLDPHRFAPRTRKLRKMIETGTFKTVPLASLVGEPVSGDWGVAEDEREADADYVKALVIRATEFDDTENLILDNDRVRFRYLERQSFESRSLQAGDLVLEKSGGGPLQPVGRVAMIEPEHLKDRQLSFTNFVMRLRPTGEVLPVYLWAFLGLVNRCGLTESMQAQTHGIRNLKLDEYLPQPTPVPDPATQKKIAAEVSRRRDAARRLREDAAQLWDDAKRRFEEELLGPVATSR